MFLNVLTQVGVLIILILLGYLLSKLNIINEVGAKCMTDLVLYAVTPCVIVISFIRPFEKSMGRNLIISTVSAILAHAVFFALSILILKSKDIKRERVLRFAAVFGNCGFMALPLQEALLGEDGVFYGASVVAVFNLFVGSFGIFLMSGDTKYVKPKALVLSPSIIAILIGIVIFLLSADVPDIIKSPMKFMAGLNT
ncbi:MAG: AEC family transporter, partial [Clostridia bacterium]|nr:AEC family transporter [Clostridia bacterium]